MSIANRLQAYSSTHPLSLNRKLDQYLSEKLPDLMDEYKIADNSDLKDVDGNLESLEGRLEDLNTWKIGFSEKMDNTKTKLDRLKIKHGVE